MLRAWLQFEFSDRDRKDFNRLDRNLQERIGAGIDELASDLHDSRISGTLANTGVLRKPRVGGWKIVFTIDDEIRIVSLLMIKRRGQVYRRM